MISSHLDIYLRHNPKDSNSSHLLSWSISCKWIFFPRSWISCKRLSNLSDTSPRWPPSTLETLTTSSTSHCNCSNIFPFPRIQAITLQDVQHGGYPQFAWAFLASGTIPTFLGAQCLTLPESVSLHPWCPWLQRIHAKWMSFYLHCFLYYWHWSHGVFPPFSDRPGLSVECDVDTVWISCTTLYAMEEWPTSEWDSIYHLRYYLVTYQWCIAFPLVYPMSLLELNWYCRDLSLGSNQ